MSALSVTASQVLVSTDTSLAASAMDYGKTVFSDPSATVFPTDASGATVTFTVSTGALNAITTTPAAGGTGYPASSTFILNVTGGGGTGGQVLATTNSSGVVTAFAATAVTAGSGYSNTTGAATAGTDNPSRWTLATQILIATAKANCTAAGATSPLVGITNSRADAAGQYVNVWQTTDSTSLTIGAGAAPADGTAYYVGGTAGNIYPSGDGGLTSGLENIFLGIGDGVSKIVPLAGMGTYTGISA